MVVFGGETVVCSCSVREKRVTSKSRPEGESSWVEDPPVTGSHRRGVVIVVVVVVVSDHSAEENECLWLWSYEVRINFFFFFKQIIIK